MPFNLLHAIFVYFKVICIAFLGMAPPPPVDVNVISHHMQRYAVWFGGSMLTSTVSYYPSFVLTVLLAEQNSTDSNLTIT